MNLTHDIEIEGVALRINAMHTPAERGAERLEVEVYHDGELVGARRTHSRLTKAEVGAPTAKSALAAVYVAIERQVGPQHIDNPGALSGLADLVNALMSASVTEG